jgi:hypothetical protein
MEFDKEVLEVGDGGTVGIYWSVEGGGRGRPEGGDERPILLLYPGISGCHQNLYTLNIIYEA